MPADPQIPQPTSRTPRVAPRQAPWFPWKSILLVSGVMLGVYAVLESPREISRWHMAAANESWMEAEMATLHGDANRTAEKREQAFAELEQALKWNPDDVNWLFVRSHWNSEIGKQEAALADCNQVISQVGERSPLLEMRMQCYQKLGRHAEAVKDANQLDSISQTSGYPPRGYALNTVAYAKAVGQIDLPKALEQSDQSVRGALQKMEQNKRDDEADPGMVERFFGRFVKVSHWHRDFEARAQLHVRQDTRGFVYYQMGDYPKALADLDAAADGYTAALKESEEGFKIIQRASPDSRRDEINAAQRRIAEAVILYHRALVHEKLGHSAAAAADHKRVFELIGRDGNEKLF